MKLKIRLAGEEETLEVQRRGDRLEVTRRGVTRVARVLSQDGVSLVLQLGDGESGEAGPRRRIRVAGVALDGTRRQVWLPGRTLTYERVPERGPGAAVDVAGGTLSPSIPAVVSEVLVSVGETVEVGQKLILLESMKMVIPIVAPIAGTVTAVYCAAGEAVQPGFNLVDLEEAPG